MKKVRINQGRIVPIRLRLGGTVVVLILMAAVLMHLTELAAVFVCIFLSFLVPLLWSSYYLLEINPMAKEISEINWIMSFTIRKVKAYDEIEKIFINETRSSRQMTSYGGQVHTDRIHEYKAFLKFSDGSNHLLLSDRNPDDLEEKVGPVAQKLNCVIARNYETS